MRHSRTLPCATRFSSSTIGTRAGSLSPSDIAFGLARPPSPGIRCLWRTGPRPRVDSGEALGAGPNAAAPQILRNQTGARSDLVSMYSLNRSIACPWVRLPIAIACLLISGRAAALISSELSVDFRGTWLRTSEGKSSLALLLELNVPLDPVRPSSVHGSLLQDEQTTSVDDVPLDPLERDNPEVSVDDTRDVQWDEAMRRPVAVVEPLQISPEFVAELTAAALVAQGYDAAWSRLESLGTRNRVSALLPEVSLRVGREQDTALRLTPTDADPFRYTQSDSSNTLLEGRVAWRLGRLLFSSEDLGLERLKLARARERQRLVERTLVVLFQWLRAQSEVAAARKAASRTARIARWEVMQAAPRLDAMTAGWFSAHSAALLAPLSQPRAPKPAGAPSPPGEASSAPQGSPATPERHKAVR
jgi:hypothetical protein